MSFLNNLKLKTRWDGIPSTLDGFRLLCSHEECSLSCANIKNGRLSVTSVHGTDRHSQQLSKVDMAFLTISFLNSLSDTDLVTFLKLFNKTNETFNLKLEKINGFLN